jgi:hypothetical protein
MIPASLPEDGTLKLCHKTRTATFIGPEAIGWGEWMRTIDLNKRMTSDLQYNG